MHSMIENITMHPVTENVCYCEQVNSYEVFSVTLHWVCRTWHICMECGMA